MNALPSADIAAAIDLVLAFHNAEADAAARLRFTHSVWSAKHASGDGVERFARDDPPGRPVSHDGAPHVSAVHACFGDLTMVRIDDFARGAVRMHFLLKQDGAWRLVGEIGAAAEQAARSARFAEHGAEAALRSALADYYRAVTEGDAPAIRALFAPCWEMKNLEHGRIVAEGVDAFVARIEPGPLPGYWDDRQVTHVEFITDRVALMRVDRPSRPSTTAFAFFRIGAAWRMTDKIWADGAPAVP
jgi:hypothetical protein